MKLKIYLFCMAISFVLFFRNTAVLQSNAGGASGITYVEKFHLFEASLLADSTYANPYADVMLSVQVRRPDGTEFTSDGYWQGGATWKIRLMPTMQGHWSYRTSSNDAGLAGVSGAFECLPSSRGGILMANPDYPYTFKLSEGAPFFWMGETSWWLMSKDVSFTDGSFHQLIDKRLEQKFNGIHFVLGTGGSPYGTKNPENEGGKLWISQQEQRINPEFFQWMDRRIAYLDSAQIAIGFYITWAQHFITFTTEEFERFERYLIARYSAYPVLYWIIVGEFDEAGAIADYNYHGQVIDRWDPYGHLIAIHPNHHDQKNVGTNRIFANEPWCDMIIQQLPQFPVWQSYHQVYQSVLADRIYGKPVANVEYGYENKDYSGKIVTSDWIRKYAWSIVCAGGFFSYGNDATIRTVNLNALESDGIQYLGYLYNFFHAIEWWKLGPEPARASTGYCLANFPAEAVIYLPDSGALTIDFSGLSETYRSQWLDPVTGAYSPVTEFDGGGIETFRSIYESDAVLHIWQRIDPPVHQVSGRVVYDQNESNVAAAILNLIAENITLAVTTDLAGCYRFENLAERSYALVPSKNDDLRDAISGADALLLLQFLESRIDLTDDQKRAVELTGDHAITMADAEALLNYLAFDHQSSGSAGQWRFAPDTATCFLRADTTIDFQSWLMGDVNGSWNSSKTTPDSSHGVDTTATWIKIATKNVSSSQQISIPIEIDNLDMPLQTLVFRVKFKPDILKFISATKTSASQNFMLATNGNERGIISLALVGSHGITAPGNIIELNFEVINRNLRVFSTDLEIHCAQLNDANVTQFKNGRVIFGKPQFVEVASAFPSIQNYPNPFNSMTTIAIHMLVETKLRIVIFNTLGQIAARLFEANLKPGVHEITWDGTSEQNVALPSGVYCYRIESIAENGEPAAIAIRKLILLR